MGRDGRTPTSGPGTDHSRWEGGTAYMDAELHWRRSRPGRGLVPRVVSGLGSDRVSTWSGRSGTCSGSTISGEYEGDSRVRPRIREG